MEGELFNDYLYISNQLTNNLRDLWRRTHYWTHKFRGDVVKDVNVAIDITTDGNKYFQIFIGNNGKWIRERVEFNTRGRLISREIKHNLLD